jgi:hypothetical protein
VSSLYFEGSREDYIAEHEKYLAFAAALYSLSKMNDIPQVIELQEFRRTIQGDTGFPFSERALRLGLQANEALQIAVPVSNTSGNRQFTVNRPLTRTLIRVLSSRQENRLWKLQNTSHEWLRSEVDTVRKDAAKKFDEGSKHGYVWKPQDNWTDYSFEYLYSVLNDPKSAEALGLSDDSGVSINWSKWGAIAGIVAIPLAVLLWWFA